ncbi:MAG TPA: hypothetical protein VK934_03615 [Fimbriimonas sp.]|nr:hypothetical protein [Fimbriimonas sp.]
MNNELYKKLVDLYAGQELPSELQDQLELAAFKDPELNHDMSSLRRTVEVLQNDSGPNFTEESYQRILMRLYSRGVEVQTQKDAPVHMQYYLPMQG